MKFLYLESLNGRSKMITMEHEGERLEWMVEKYRQFKSNEYTFGDINKHLARLTPEAQQALWDIYQGIYDNVTYIADLNRLEKAISAKLKKIEEILPYKVISDDVIGCNTVWMPTSPEEETMVDTTLNSFDIDIEDDSESNEDSEDNDDKNENSEVHLTYDRYNQQHLNALAIYLKLYLPVLSHFYHQLESEDIKFYRCYKTIKLLDHMKFMQERGYTRLYDYVEYFWSGRPKKKPLNPGILLKGLSQEQAPGYILAEFIYKKLLPVGISHTYHDIPDEERPNIIKGLFHNMKSYADTLMSGDRSNYFIPKDNSNNTSVEEDQLSNLENYKITAELSEAAKVTVDVFLEDIENILAHVDPTLPRELVDSVVYIRERHKSYHPYRLTLTKWLMYSVVSPKFIDYIDDKAYENVFKVSLALLQHWRFEDIARIYDGDIEKGTERNLVFTTMEITSDQVSGMLHYYPHGVPVNRVKNNSKRDGSYPIIACSQMEGYVRGVTFIGTNYHGRWTNTSNVKHDLANLLLHMNQFGFIQPS